MTLLAENETGYRNLMKLSSRAFLEGYYYKPRMDFDLLAEHSEGIIATSGCLAGWSPTPRPRLRDGGGKPRPRPSGTSTPPSPQRRQIPGHLRAGQLLHRDPGPRASRPSADHARSARHRPADRRPAAGHQRRPLHPPRGAEAHDVLLCIQTGRARRENRFRFDAQEFYLKSAAEMRALFPDDRPTPGPATTRCGSPSGRTSTSSSARSCCPSSRCPRGRPRSPTWSGSSTRGRRSATGPAPGGAGADRARAEDHRGDGLSRLLPHRVGPDPLRPREGDPHRARAGLGGRLDRRLLPADHRPRPDPLRADLRAVPQPGPSSQMPDIDMDFDERYRADVIRYAAEKYGSDHVAQIVTFSTIKGKQAIRDAARVLGHPYGLGDKVAKAMPPAILGKEATLTQVLETPTRGGGGRESRTGTPTPRAAEMYELDPAVPQVVDAARDLEGLRRQDSIHAAAVVISRAADRPDPRSSRRARTPSRHPVRDGGSGGRWASSRWTSSACATSPSSSVASS
jgi:DNA polymerase III subunit alpha